jgi:hypothetical protein
MKMRGQRGEFGWSESELMLERALRLQNAMRLLNLIELRLRGSEAVRDIICCLIEGSCCLGSDSPIPPGVVKTLNHKLMPLQTVSDRYQ